MAEKNNIKEFQVSNRLVPTGVITQTTIVSMIDIFKLQSKEHFAHFLGQLAHETSNFTRGTEDTYYSPGRLMEKFSTRFPTLDSTKGYANNSEAMANYVYKKRNGNGDEASGDGYRYRGRGAVQLTGFDQYKAFSEAINNPEIMLNPDIVADRYYWESAKFYFDSANLWSWCDVVDDPHIFELSRRINGRFWDKDEKTGEDIPRAAHGYEDRKDKTYKFYKMVKQVERTVNLQFEPKLNFNVSESIKNRSSNLGAFER